MQLRILLNILRLYQLDESWERRFRVHHLEDGVVFTMPAIVEQKCRDYVKRRVVFLLSRQSALSNRLHPSRVTYLEETVYNLPPHILLVHDV
jgi:hypothetical protein